MAYLEVVVQMWDWDWGGAERQRSLKHCRRSPCEIEEDEEGGEVVEEEEWSQGLEAYGVHRELQNRGQAGENHKSGRESEDRKERGRGITGVRSRS